MSYESWDFKLFSGGVFGIYAFLIGFVFRGWLWQCVWERFRNVLLSLRSKLGGYEAFTSFT